MHMIMSEWHKFTPLHWQCPGSSLWTGITEPHPIRRSVSKQLALPPATQTAEVWISCVWLYCFPVSILAAHLSPVTAPNVSLPGSRSLSPPSYFSVFNLLGARKSSHWAHWNCVQMRIGPARAGAQRALCPPFSYSQPDCWGWGDLRAHFR